MPKKRLYLIIGITAIITLGFFFAAYIISRPQKNTGDTPSGILQFFPFGQNLENTKKTNKTDTKNTTSQENTNTDNSLLFQISETPIAGMYSYLKSGKTAVQFTEKTTGYIFETTIEGMQRDRPSNTLAPRIEQAIWGDNGNSVIYRYIKDSEPDTIATFVMSVPKSNVPITDTKKSTESKIQGSFLPDNIIDLIVSSDSKSVFTLSRTAQFSSRVGVGNVFDFQKKKLTQVFVSPFSEWLPISFDGKTAVIETKPSQNVPGYLYSVNIANGRMEKIIGGINGLTALPSPNLQKILYSESGRGGITLHIYDRKTGGVLNLALQTIPEKCVWNPENTGLYCAIPITLPSAEYPDDWYQGNISFNDEVWKIDANTGDSIILFSPSVFGKKNFDMKNLTLSLSGKYLFFTNKNNSILWGYNLSNS
jgi:hypothetical protein